MNDERYKQIMADLGQPDSRSLLDALRQVANETYQQAFNAGIAAAITAGSQTEVLTEQHHPYTALNVQDLILINIAGLEIK